MLAIFVHPIFSLITLIYLANWTGDLKALASEAKLIHTALGDLSLLT